MTAGTNEYSYEYMCAKKAFLRNTINLNKTDVIYIKDNNRIRQSHRTMNFNSFYKNGDVRRRRL